MTRWLSHTQIRQRPSLVVYVVLIVVVTVVIGVCVLNWISSSSDDSLAVIGNFLSLGTFLLALVAGIVALVAYSAATGLPDLNLIFQLPGHGPNEGKFATISADVSLYGAQGVVTIIVRNSSSYAARTPAVILEFHGAGIASNMYAASGSWTAIARDFSTQDVLALQWDGGPNSIHGDSSRHLPELNLQGLHALDSVANAHVAVKLLADGYSHPAIVLPIEFAVNADATP